MAAAALDTLDLAADVFDETLDLRRLVLSLPPLRPFLDLVGDDDDDDDDVEDVRDGDDIVLSGYSSVNACTIEDDAASIKNNNSRRWNWRAM